MQANRTDIIFAQESHFSDSKQHRLKYHQYPHVYLANASTKRGSVLIAVGEHINFFCSQVIPDSNGRYLRLLCTLNTVQFTLVNIYTPNKVLIRFLRSLLCQIKQVQIGNLLVGSDFQAIANTKPKLNPPSTQIQWWTSSQLTPGPLLSYGA